MFELARSFGIRDILKGDVCFMKGLLKCKGIRSCIDKIEKAFPRILDGNLELISSVLTS